ncbi:MAG: GLPGLI family protein [Gemmatimonadetes bacterium]|nr:GLPGLI family protein [Gemmatimonadota bacterium]
MIRARTLLALLVGLPLAASGQSGAVRYDQSNRIDIKLPPELARNPEIMANMGRMPKASTRPMQLRFTPQAALFGPAPAAAAPGAPAGMVGTTVMIGGPGGGGGREMMVRDMDVSMASGGSFAFFGGGGSGMDAVTGAFTDLESGSYIELRSLLGRTFRITDSRPAIGWKLTGESAQFLGYPVFQAIAKQDSSTIEAWFTPDIPVSAGPAQYGGLPGLILTLAIDSNRVVFTATGVDLKTPVEKIAAPSEGSKVSRAEYDKILKEKQDEMAKSRRGRGN